MLISWKMFIITYRINFLRLSSNSKILKRNFASWSALRNKSNVKLFLYPSTMMMYGDSGGKAPHILHHSARLKWIASLTLRPFSSKKNLFLTTEYGGEATQWWREISLQRIINNNFTFWKYRLMICRYKIREYINELLRVGLCAYVYVRKINDC
jgi:hypothetical protein